MPKYSITGTLLVGVFTEVEAEDEDSARDIALQRGIQGICGRCSSSRYSDEKASEVWRLSDELNGDVEKLVVEKDEEADDAE